MERARDLENHSIALSLYLNLSIILSRIRNRLLNRHGVSFCPHVLERIGAQVRAGRRNVAFMFRAMNKRHGGINGFTVAFRRAPQARSAWHLALCRRNHRQFL